MVQKLCQRKHHGEKEKEQKQRMSYQPWDVKRNLHWDKCLLVSPIAISFSRYMSWGFQVLLASPLTFQLDHSISAYQKQNVIATGKKDVSEDLEDSWAFNKWEETKNWHEEKATK